MPSCEGNLPTQRHYIGSLGTLGENPESLSHLGLIRYRVMTPGETREPDRITIANTRLAVPAGTAAARKNETNIQKDEKCSHTALGYNKSVKTDS